MLFWCFVGSWLRKLPQYGLPHDVLLFLWTPLGGAQVFILKYWIWTHWISFVWSPLVFVMPEMKRKNRMNWSGLTNITLFNLVCIKLNTGHCLWCHYTVTQSCSSENEEEEANLKQFSLLSTRVHQEAAALWISRQVCFVFACDAYDG